MRAFRGALLSVSILSLVTAAPAVAAASVSRLDESNGVRFTLNGSRLTLRLAPQQGSSPPDVRRNVWGKRVQAICSATFSQRRAGRIAESAELVWPHGNKTLRLRLDRDVSRQVRWCLLEGDGGGDVASVTFRAFIWVGGDTKADRRIGQRLRRYLLREPGSRPWLTRVDGIVVNGGRIRVETELTPDRLGKEIARRICVLIRRSDVAGDTSGHRVLGRRGGVLRTCPAQSAVAAASVTRLDQSNGVRFTLAGRLLTLKLVPQQGSSPPDIRRKVWGKRVDAACSPSFRPRTVKRIAVSGQVVWPRGATTLTVQLDRDVSRQVRWCLLEKGGATDVAAVDFKVFIRLFGDDKPDRSIGQRLRRYLMNDFGSRPWLSRIRGIVVDDGVIAVATELTSDPRGKEIARRICSLIRTSGVAEGTPGHAVYGRQDGVLRTCSAQPAFDL